MPPPADRPTFSCFVQRAEDDVPTGEWEVHPRYSFQAGPFIPLELRQRAQHRERFLAGYPIAWIENPQTGILFPFWTPRMWCKTLMALKPGERPPHLDARMASALLRANVLIKRVEFQRQQQGWRNTLTKAKEHFVSNDYVNIAGLMHPQQLRALAGYYREVVSSFPAIGDSQCSLRYGLHNESLSRFVHVQFAPLVETLVDRPVVPSYTYLASYRGGAALERHTDREQCEITAGLLLDYEPSESGRSQWPLFLETPRGERAIFQEIGDTVVFRGRILPHWRDSLPDGHRSETLLLHYVFREFTGPLQ
jgi:hypothetical protein